MSVYDFEHNIQDFGRKPEVLITFL